MMNSYELQRLSGNNRLGASEDISVVYPTKIHASVVEPPVKEFSS